MKRMKWKRFGAALLTLAMVLSAVPGAVLAVDTPEGEAAAASDPALQPREIYDISVEYGQAERYVSDFGRVEYAITDAPVGSAMAACADEREGMAFSHWVIEQGDVVLDSIYARYCSFVMPRENVKMRAEYVPGHKLVVEDAYTERILPDGETDEETNAVAPGTKVRIYSYSDPTKGLDFSHWVVKQGHVELEHPERGVTTFVMPDEDVVIYPEFKPTGWRQNDTGYWYVDESGNYVTGWQYINSGWYYFADNGYMHTGWLQSNGAWYYFYPEIESGVYGMMATYDWEINGKRYYFDPESGQLQTGWHKSEYGSWCYFAPSGEALTGFQTIDGKRYYFDVYDRWSGFIGNEQYFFDYMTGEMVTGWRMIDGYWHYFDADGHMLTGWQKINGNWYYFTTTKTVAGFVQGFMLTGWQWINGKCYYFYEDGHMATDTWIGGSYVDGSGAWVDKPAVATGWQHNSYGYWYNDANGNYVTGWQQINGYWYYFASNGYMQTGWQVINGYWYYFSPSGDMQTGWQVINGYWYYFAPSGYMLTGWQQINGYWYYFSPSGDMQTGWEQINGYWYYFSPSGDMQTGWQWINGYCYYFYPSGYMATSTWIGGSYVNGSGVWVQ